MVSGPLWVDSKGTKLSRLFLLVQLIAISNSDINLGSAAFGGILMLTLGGGVEFKAKF
jgi:hypothetical protein